LRALVTPAELAGLKQKAREPVKGAPIELAARPRVVETALQVLESSVTQLRENAEGVRQENAPDFVHQLRVGVRRLRTAIRFFRAALDAPVLDRLLEEAAWLFRSLGPLREYDVFLRDVLGPFAGQRGVAALERAVQDERAALLNDARKALASQRFVHLVRDLLAYQGELSQRKHSLKLRGYARKKLDKRLAQANALRDAVDSKDPVAQHALRKQLKKLRYACEFVCAAFPDRAAQRYLKRLETVQDALGALQDVAVAEHVLAAQLGHLDPRTVRSPLPGKIRALLDERSARATEALARAWRKFERADPFWR
jgi:CHAD domain-containing protein